MKKEQWLKQLGSMLEGVPEEDKKASLDYYSEMIDDRMEDGMTEEQAVASLGDVNAVAAEIKGNSGQTQTIPLTQTMPEVKQKKFRKFTTMEIVLLIVTFPLWISLLAVAFSLYVTVIAVMISLYTVPFSMIAAGIGAAVAFPFVVSGQLNIALFILGAGLIMIGLSIFFIIWLNRLSKLLIKLNAKLFRAIKSFFVREA